MPTAAHELAGTGHRVLLLDRAGRIKPCGGAVPPQMLKDFDVPRDVLEAEVDSARMISPSARAVDMPIEIGYVGMVDRGSFDEWLRARAASGGATAGRPVPSPACTSRTARASSSSTARGRKSEGAEGRDGAARARASPAARSAACAPAT